MQRLTTPDNTAGLDYDADLGYPGQYPFTCGVQPTMYRGRFWIMRQYAGISTVKESNECYKCLLEQGQTGLSVVCGLPTQIGYDADHPLADFKADFQASTEHSHRIFQNHLQGNHPAQLLSAGRVSAASYPPARQHR